MAANEKYWFLPFALIDLLEKVPGDEATAALVSLLDCPFDKVVLEENVHYTADDYHESIHKALETRTGYKLPPHASATQWREWLQKRDANGKPIIPLRRAIEKRFGPPDRSDNENNCLHYDLSTGDILTLILDGERLLGTVTTRATNLKSVVGKRVTLVGQLGMDVDGDAVYTPDGATVQLGGRDARDTPSNAFVSVTGVVERGPWDYRLTGKVDIKILYGAKSPPASPSR